MALLHHCVHQTHIKHHAKTKLLMLIKPHFRLKYALVTIQHNSNKKRCKVSKNVYTIIIVKNSSLYYKKIV